MNKHEEDKLSNSIIELYKEIKKQGENTGRQLAKMNLALGEMRLSYIKLDEKVERLNGAVKSLDGSFNKRIINLDDSFNRYARSNEARLSGHETRIVRLEEKTSGGSYLVREPSSAYKKKKRK